MAALVAAYGVASPPHHPMETTMHVTPTRSYDPDTPGASAPAPLPPPPLARTMLATAYGAPNGNSTRSLGLFDSGWDIGSSEGYASLDAARDAISQLTAGPAIPAAAIFRVDDRYHALLVDRYFRSTMPDRDWHPSVVEEGYAPVHLEDDPAWDGGIVVPMRSAVVAVVDGARTLPVGAPPSY